MNVNTAPPVETFESELTALVNKYSLEPLSGTPDFILAYYMKDCLVAFQNAQTRRSAWYSKKLEQREGLKQDRASQMGDLTE